MQICYFYDIFVNSSQ